MSKVLVVAGMPRSGTTWLFNAARKIVLDAGLTYTVWPHWMPHLFPAVDPTADWQIHKVHGPMPRLADRADVVVVSHRDGSEVRASMGRCFGESEKYDEAWLARVEADYLWWRERADCDLLYPDLIAAPAACVRSLASAMNLPSDAETVAGWVDGLEPPTDKGYDPETMMFRHHRPDRDGGGE